MQRRELFKKIMGAKQAPKDLAPPYFSGSFDCTNCSSPCVSACKRELLEFMGQSVNFSVKTLGCNFCKECAIACENENRSTLNLKFSAKIDGLTKINTELCVAWHQVICSSCLDSCRYKAIDFLGLFRPLINQNCINCGECVSVCFKNAITQSAN